MSESKGKIPFVILAVLLLLFAWSLWSHPMRLRFAVSFRRRGIAAPSLMPLPGAKHVRFC